MAGDERGRPILTGLAALVGVGMVVGGLMSLAALLGVSVLGLSGGDDEETQSAARESMVVPTPTPTDRETGPQMTLAPGEPTPTTTPTQSAEPEKSEIQLNASPSSVSPMGRIDLTGTYPGGDGAILQVQRKQEGQDWEDFPVDASVSNGTFRTWIQTGRTGRNEFRMMDTSSGRTSNVVAVTIG